MSVIPAVTAAARNLADAVDQLPFAAPVSYVYNPLRYAWKAHQKYIGMLNREGCRVLLLGMNPGPWGMAQTGVPFGQVAAVRDWMQIDAPITRPTTEHPKRPVEGWGCQRSEVSGERLWGLMQSRFPDPTDFFHDHFVVNYCPLIFMEQSGRNRTPDKLPSEERGPLVAACDVHLIAVLDSIKPEIAVGVGVYAEQCLQRVRGDRELQVTRILHPSPASPAANRGWAVQATSQLIAAGVWDS